MNEISSERTLLEKLSANEQKFRQLADTIPQILWSAGTDGELSFINGRWLEYAGESPERAEFSDEQAWINAIHPDDRRCYLDGWNAALIQRCEYKVELRLRRGDGAYHWHLVRAMPNEAESSRSVRWFATVMDIDSLKKTEESLSAEKSQKDEFLAMLSHELRNPLAAISAALRLFDHPHLEDKRPWALTVTRRQVKHLIRLIDDLLDFTRITRGRFEIYPSPFNIAPVISRGIEIIQSAIESRNLTVEIEIDPLIVYADPRRVEQAIVNLLTNAAKYTPPGGSISLEVIKEEGRAVVAIGDTGAGIAPEMLERIFEPFFQREMPQPNTGGLGIELPLAKKLVEMNGGSISAASAGIGLGSQFTFSLPLARCI